MNHLFFGRSGDLNIGNGKTVSAIDLLLEEYFVEDKTIFSNIKLNNVDYTELTPLNIDEVLETDNAIVLLDELHAIVDIHHKVHPNCKRHEVIGTCYELSELFRQVRKRNITTLSTVQTYSDCVYRLRIVMQESIICEKFDVSKGIIKKCQEDTCPSDHIHLIKQTNFRTGKAVYLDPLEPINIFEFYDSSEIVKGWQMVDAR